MVELRRLIAMQHWVDTDVSDGVHGLQMQEGIGGLLAKCLSPDDLNPSAQTRWTKMVVGNPIKPMLVVLTGFSLDNSYGLRRAEHDPKTNLVQVTLGSNANLMLIREFGGRYVLAQGYHRAWLLRSRGVDMVPVVVIHVPTPMDLTAPGFIQLPHLLSNRPPTVDDFFNDEVSVDVDVRAMMSTVKITIESSPAPRLL